MSRDLSNMTPSSESHNCMINSISRIITPLTASITSVITSTLSSISYVLTSAIQSHNLENALFPEFSEYISNNESVPLNINQSKLAPIPSSERNCASLNNSNSAFDNSEVEEPHNNVSINSNINVNIPSINNDVSASAHVNLNSTSTVLTYGLSSRLTTAPPLDVRDDIISSAIIETPLSVAGPKWPTELNTESLVSVLLAQPSNIYVCIKRHTQSVQKFMHFLSDGTSSMPVTVTDAYNQLKRDLNKLRNDLNKL